MSAIGEAILEGWNDRELFDGTLTAEECQEAMAEGIADAMTSGTLSDALPANIGTASAGVSNEGSRADHVHAHGNQAGGALHSEASTSAAGFMSAADKRLVPWTLAAKPASPHADDDEFESGSLTGWTQGGTPVGTAIDPYASFSTAANWRSSNNSIRPSWLLIQPPADAATLFPIHKAVTVGSNFAMWARLGFTSRHSATVSNGDHVVGISLHATSGGAPSTSDRVAVFLSETDANEYALQFDKTEGGVLTPTEIVLAQKEERLAWEYVLMQKISTTFHFWAAPGNGNWTHLGSFTYSGAALDRAALHVSNAATTSPGNMIVGVDFIRFSSSASFFV